MEKKKKLNRGVLSAEAVRRLEKKGNRVQASSKVGFQVIKYRGGHVEQIPERMEGAAMIEYIGFQPETAQKLWRTLPNAQKQSNELISVYAHAKKYLTRKFEEHKHRRTWNQELLLAAVGLSSNLVQSLIYLSQRISISQRFKLNKISLHDLRDWAIIKIKKIYYKMKSLDAQVLLDSPHHHKHPSSSSSSLGMFPLSLKRDVVPGQIVAVSGKPVADGFYLEKNGQQLVPGWKASDVRVRSHLLNNNINKDKNKNNNNNGITPVHAVVVANICFAQVLPPRPRF